MRSGHKDSCGYTSQSLRQMLGRRGAEPIPFQESGSHAYLRHVHRAGLHLHLLLLHLHLLLLIRLLLIRLLLKQHLLLLLHHHHLLLLLLRDTESQQNGQRQGFATRVWGCA